jgi:hypothetical protein
MSSVKPLNGSPSLAGVGVATEMADAGAAQAVTAGATAPLDAVFPAVFERVRELVGSGQVVSPEAALRLAVGDVLNVSLSAVAPAVREGLTERVARVIADDPLLRPRLDRLLGLGAP